MHSLKFLSDHIVGAINDGPSALDPHIFAGPPERVFKAFQLHATTINRARIRTLEAHFPDVRARLGEAAFRQKCDDYIATPDGRARDLNGLAAGFEHFLNK
jgi:Putative DNA-binding domain